MSIIVNCLVVDDEPLARQKLESFIGRLPGWKVARSCGNAIEAYEALQTLNVDLIFLDIKMPLLSGVDFLRSLKNPPLVVFTTAFAKYALDGFELQALDYLLKPIAFERFLKTAERVNESLASRQAGKPEPVPYLFIKEDQKFIRVDYSAILYLEAMNDYVKIHTSGKNHLVNASLSAYESLLPRAGFIRVHRSYLVAVAAITLVKGNIIVIGEKEIPIGGSYREGVMKLIGG
jgi:two-component system, LytTR family, response regulator